MEECLKRADEVDAKILRLHETVGEINTLLAETPQGADGGGEALAEYQAAMLEKLRALRISMDEEGAQNAAIKSERDSAVSSLATSEEKLAKQQFRIVHLLRAIEAGVGGGGS
eukprot:CAMPEP_0114131696 /NCGR_PEP_ID=MMETSP0043_2-20121206/12695_1 /TAXON_ID=464988 /ORGANISM="Hemiselmis andersenii, Strain CCMP644" /LENGTH=112 /DNA_ID=CAMNT_0001225153 /DNA_START=60 /DNA_END=395 /DNA_ORIENTATION=-